MTEEVAFKKGDVVRVKPGTAMCVEAVQDDGSIRCVWFDEERQLHRAAFISGALERCEPHHHEPPEGGWVLPEIEPDG